jgi:hypothetical protein
MFQAKNYTAAADGFTRFAEDYPDSDYRDPALMLAFASEGYLKDEKGVLKVAEQMVRLPTAEPALRAMAFVELSGDLSVYVRPEDPEKERKLADLEKWTRCGKEALAADIRTPNMPQDTLDSRRKPLENVLDRTAGFVAYMRQDYLLADTTLEAASKLNSEDALTYLWLATNKFFLPVPDANSGIFYLARWAELAPQGYWATPKAAEVSTGFLKQIYVIVHGSDKGLSDVRALARTNTVPPPGFNVLPKPKVKHHYGSAIAATAVVGLLVYGLVRDPELMGAMGRSFGASAEQPQQGKVMIFGGPGHEVYLGCLSCSDLESDSVFNELGHYGSPHYSESIWNRYGQFGSEYSEFSACNPYATDPPIIVDQQGQTYGRLTVNQLNSNIGAGARFYNWLASAVCHK